MYLARINLFARYHLCSIARRLWHCTGNRAYLIATEPHTYRHLTTILATIDGSTDKIALLGRRIQKPSLRFARGKEGCGKVEHPPLYRMFPRYMNRYQGCQSLT
jgi:hypothetical protein